MADNGQAFETLAFGDSRVIVSVYFPPTMVPLYQELDHVRDGLVCTASNLMVQYTKHRKVQVLTGLL